MTGWIVFGCIVGYVCIAIYRGIVGITWWEEHLSGRKEFNRYNTHKLFRDAACNSGWCCGVIWPLWPVIKRAMEQRKKDRQRNAERAMREAEIKEAEKELDA